MVKIWIICLLVLSNSIFAGNGLTDSVKTTGLQYNSFGFNASSVSGLGLAFRHHAESFTLIQVSGGILKSDSNVAYSLGAEYQYELSRRQDFRYYICLGSGLYNSGGSTDFTAGFGVGFDTPVFGHTIKENMTAGLSLFYPTLYTGTGGSSVSFGASLYFYYNF